MLVIGSDPFNTTRGSDPPVEQTKTQCNLPVDAHLDVNQQLTPIFELLDIRTLHTNQMYHVTRLRILGRIEVDQLKVFRLTRIRPAVHVSHEHIVSIERVERTKPRTVDRCSGSNVRVFRG